MRNDRRPAPWWVYAAVALVVNVIRLALFPSSEVGTFWTIALFAVVLAVAAVIVRAGHRVSRRLVRSRS